MHDTAKSFIFSSTDFGFVLLLAASFIVAFNTQKLSGSKSSNILVMYFLSCADKGTLSAVDLEHDAELDFLEEMVPDSLASVFSLISFEIAFQFGFFFVY